MEIQDLRIGNWVLLTKDEFKTTKPYKLDAFDIYKASESDCADIAPIFLTEEILLKCGFEKQDYNMSNCHVYQKGIYRILKSFNSDNINQDYSLCINGISPPTWSIAHFKFVHQFQNIIHALTNTELEINL